MNRSILAAALLFVPGLPSFAQSPATSSGDANLPAPGARGNADNVPYIGKSDPQGNPVRLARSTGHVSNYSEEKIPPYTLPDPLVMQNGDRVTSAGKWFAGRRGEILKFYENEIYGRVPANAPQVTWRVTETDSSAREGTATMKRVVGTIGERPDAPRMNLTVYLPPKARSPVPLLLSLTFAFGAGGPARQAAAPGRGPLGGFDAVGEVLKRGWGYASLGYTDIQPDRADRWTEGVVGQTLREGRQRPDPDEWGTISAWAWGISRSIDYFETDPAVNAKQVAITGVSRLGKTVLWAGARDQRVAAVFSVVSGEMGASLIRRDWGETLDDMAQNFPWQFAGNLQKWVGKWNELPVDQHLLIALCAPRPVYVNGGLTDQWSDPKGEFLSLVAAGPVYRLLGAKDLGVTDLPPLDQPLTSGDLAFHYHSGGHSAVPADWKAFLDFADRHFLAANVQSQSSSSSPADAARAAKSDEQQEKKAAEWVGSLDLADPARSARVTEVIATHLKTIRDWHNEHPFTTVPAGINPVTGRKLSDLDRQVIANSAIPKSVHENLMAGLRRDLTPQQVEAILDKYTIGKVPFTMSAYRAIVPDLTAEEEATILAFLKQAREEAVDYKNMNQISVIFEIYKTKSEQYLNSNGRNWRDLYKAYTDAVRAKKAAAAKPNSSDPEK